MLAKVTCLSLAIAVVLYGDVAAQTASRPATPRTSGKWRSPKAPKPAQSASDSQIRQTSGISDDGVAPLNSAGPLGPASQAPRQPIARVTEGSGALPNDAGQVWREYDITPYVVRVTSTNRPEQAIVDWVLRDTGYEAWHSEPFRFLSASRARYASTTLHKSRRQWRTWWIAL